MIASARDPNVLIRLAAKEPIGTLFHAHTNPKESRKRWLLSEKVSRWRHGRRRSRTAALRVRASQPPIGVTGIAATFDRGAVIEILAQ